MQSRTTLNNVVIVSFSRSFQYIKLSGLFSNPIHSYASKINTVCSAFNKFTVENRVLF